MNRLVVFGLAALASAAPLLAQMPPVTAWQAYRSGQLALSREDFAKAEQQFRVAIRADRTFSLAYYGLGTVMASTRRYPEAVDAFTGAIAAHQDRIARQATDAAKLDQQRDEEIRELHDTLRALPRMKFVSPHLPLLLEHRIAELEREKAGEKTAERGHVPAEYYVALGSAHHHVGHLDEARAAYEQAVKINAALGEARNNLAVLALARGDAAEAREQVRLADAAGFQVHPDLRRDVGLSPEKAAEAAPAPSALAIEHEPLACAVAGRHPFLVARVSGSVAASRMRVRFRSPVSSYLYSVRMQPEGARFVARLPMPTPDLGFFTYTIDATGDDAASARTEEIKVPVVAAAECASAPAPPTRQALLVEIPDSAPARPPVPGGFRAEGVKGVGGTKVGITNLPAKLGAAVGVVGVAVGAATAKSSIYRDNSTPVSVAPQAQVELLSVDPPSGSTIASPSQRIQATFRVTMPAASQRPVLTARMQNQLSGSTCIEIVGAAGPQVAGATFELTAVGPAEASRACPATFEVIGLGVTLQADDGQIVSERFFPVRYTVVRPPGS